jgi:NSS family neurotransmitter:Na+ symporter
MMQVEKERERLGSRLGFILLSAGCAIGCGNVWKFPWMTGQYGGGGFVLIYIICLLLLGLPVMTMEFAIGRASQASPVRMYQKLEKPKQKWHIHGVFALIGNICLMAFYTVVTGWMIHYFVMFLSGQNQGLGFGGMITNPGLNIAYLAIAVVVGFGILCFKLQGGLERVTKYMMIVLLLLMVVLAIHSATLPGAGEGLTFYLLPDFSKINGEVIVGAMNQAFFTLSLGIGSMAIFGSYTNKNRSLMGESVNVVALDTFVAIVAGLIIFPACFTYNVEVNAGPALLFDTMATVFNNMDGGRWWGALFFLFMLFAALSTVLAVFETILACVRELTGWSRPKGCIICGIGIFILACTTALGYSVLHFQPFAEGSAWLDFWDFIVSTNLLPLGSLVIALFCCSKRYGWGWDNFMLEANTGKGLKVRNWMKPVFKYLVPILILIVYIYGLATFSWR